MEQKVIYRDRQELQSEDLNNAQDFMQAALDHVVLDTIENGKAYSGFAVAKTGAAEVTVQTGRLYAGGSVFAKNSDTVIDLLSILPLATQKRIAIVAWGQTVETDVQPRDFLIDAQIGTTEPQSVSMRKDRACQISTVAGVESPDPAYPTTDVDRTVIAYVLCDTGGVVSVEQWEDTQVENLRNLSTLLDALNSWRDQIGSRVETLATDLYALAERQNLLATKSDLAAIRLIMMEIKDKLDQPQPSPPAYLHFLRNNFASTADAQTGHGSYDAKIDRGLKFDDANSDEFELELLNPLEPQVTTINGVTLPGHTNKRRMFAAGYNREHRAGSVTFNNRNWTQSAFSRSRIGIGPQEIHDALGYYLDTFSPNSPAYNQILRLLSRVPNEAGYNYGTRYDEFWKELEALERNGQIEWVFEEEYFELRFKDPFWPTVQTVHVHTAYEHAQPFKCSQDGWLTQIGLYFSRKAATGDVNIMVCEMGSRGPNVNKVVSHTTLDVADIKVGGASGGAGLPAVVETLVPITPAALKAGKSYAVIIASEGDHWIAISDSQADYKVFNGVFQYGQDAEWTPHTSGGVIKMGLYFAEFTTPRITANLQPLSLAGGIRGIDILGQIIHHGAGQFLLEGQIAGKWRPIKPGQPLDLSSLPTSLPLRATFEGTTDVQAAAILSGSSIIVRRPDTSFTFVSNKRTLGSNATTVYVRARLKNFIEANHDLTCILRTVDDSVTEAADATADTEISDGTIEREWTFNIAAGDDYHIELTGTTNTVNSEFVVMELIDEARA